MSTKASLAYGDNFHLYEEAFDDNHIYLSLDKVEFEACQNGVMVAIPLHIWECIRKFSNARFDLVDHSHEMILEMVTTEVDKRIARYMENGKRPGEAVFGCLTFGLASEPREEQIEKGLSYYLSERQKQRSIKEKLEKLLAENSG